MILQHIATYLFYCSAGPCCTYVSPDVLIFLSIFHKWRHLRTCKTFYNLFVGRTFSFFWNRSWCSYFDFGAVITCLLLICSGPREDATRIGSAGVVRRQAVDISPLRRVNQAIYLLTTGARESAFRNIKSIAECLADELINAAKGSSNR